MSVTGRDDKIPVEPATVSSAPSGPRDTAATATVTVPPARLQDDQARSEIPEDGLEVLAPEQRLHPSPPVGEEPRSVPLAVAVLVGATVVAGVVVRFATSSPLWLDEALSVNIAQLPMTEIGEALRHDGHPPLYYFLLHLWMELVGSGDRAVRALSGVISVLTLPLAFLAGRRLGGPRLAWLTLGLVAASPFLVRYATETRMYSLVSFLVFAGYLLLDDIVRRTHDSWPRVALLAVVVAGLLYAHYWSLWLLAATGGLLLAHAWSLRRATTGGTHGSETATQRRAVVRAILALVAGGVAFLPWLPSMLYQSAHTGTPWAGPVRPTAMVATTLTDLGGGASGATYAEPALAGALVLVLVLLAVFGATIDRWRILLDLRTVAQFRAEALVIVSTLAVATVAGYASRSTFASRYASAIMPLVLLLAAGGLTRLGDRRVLAGSLATVVVLFGAGCYFNVRTDRSQAAAVAAKVAERAQPGDVVVYCPDQLAPAALRVMPAGLEHFAFSHLPGDPWPTNRVDWVNYKDQAARDPRAYARAVAGHAGPAHAVFVVWSGAYKTHEESCGQLVDELRLERGTDERLVLADGQTFFESANLEYFPATRTR